MAIVRNKATGELSEVRTVNTRTYTGLLEAERLHLLGWKVVNRGLYELTMQKIIEPAKR